MSKDTSTRQNKVARQIQRDLAVFFQREQQSICLGNMVTVTHVRVTPDLSIARIYLSIFPSNKANDTLTSIKVSTKIIRFYLGTQIKNQLRNVPELEFFIDDSLDYYEKINKLLNH